MRRIDVLQISLLALSVLLFGVFATSCDPDGVVPDDDDVTPPATDDDDDDDDDATSGPSSMTFDPSDVNAGAIVDVAATVENFALGGNAQVCCADDDVLLFGFDTEASTDDVLLFSFFFGLRADGTQSWGIDNGSDQVEADFEVTALPAVDEVDVGPAAAAGDIAAGGFEAFHFEVTAPNQFVMARATGTSPDAFHPWVWLLDDDGRTGISAGGFPNVDAPGGYDAPVAAFFAAEAGSYFVRVEDDLDGAGSYQLDLASVDAGAPYEIAEVEPNDVTDDWQVLGTLVSGRYLLTGQGETAGHDADNDLNGDLDGFRFQVQEDTVVSFLMNFPKGQDFDAVLYDDTAGDTEFGFGSAQAINLDMASTGNPESTSVVLTAGTPYVLGIGNWDGDAAQDWTMAMTVVPGTFPGDDGGDDDDSSTGDDDDSSTGDDDDSGR